MKIGSICSGYEGLGMAVQATLGGELAWVADNDPDASRLLACRFPGVPNLGDIKAVDWSSPGAVDVLCGGYPCFTSDAQVLTRDGYRQITEVKPGDLVLTHRHRWRPITAVMTKFAKETVEVSAQGTNRTRCTSGHPWWTSDGNWVAAKEMQGQRAVQILPEQETLPPELTPAVLWVLGRHLADGYIQDRKGRPGAGRVTITCAHHEADEVLAGLRLAGLQGYTSRERTATKIAVTRNWFYMLARQCGQGAANKHVPGWLISGLDETCAEALLSGYLSGDGHREDRGTVHAFTATTISKGLAYSMALVAQRARGVVCSVRLNVVPPETTIEGRTVSQRPFWKLTVPDRNRSGQVSAGRETAYKLCRSVTASGSAQVYNLAVAEDESYVVDNAVVHNCQPFSQAGRRLGAEDERHLWPYIARAIGALHPPLVVLENVHGHLTLGFDQVLADLAGLGYDAEWTVVTASAAGACHRRARLFVLAFPATGRPLTGVPLAVARDGAWLEPCESLFGELPFTGRVPASGSMAGGRICEAQNGPVTEMADGLLKTPTAQLAVNGGSQHPDKRRAGGHGPTLADQVEHELLPTPQATDGNGGPRMVPAERTHRGADHGPRLRDVAPALLPTPSVADGTGGHKTRSGDRKGEPLLGGIAMLLPTPAATDSNGARNATASRRNAKPSTVTTAWTLSDVIWQGELPPGADTSRLLPTPAAGNFNDGESLESWEARRQANLAKGINGNGQGTPLAVAARQAGTDWGPYEAAIRHWEAVTGRPAPRPTVPGKTGERLNPALPEWMMGLPAGWITEVPGLSRNAQLKIAGNGVVPQQGALALRLLLARAGLTELEEAA